MQQHLPFTVLKLGQYANPFYLHLLLRLQQHLPFTVLKLILSFWANKFTVGLQQHLPFTVLKRLTTRTNTISIEFSCNSTYRLRYWNCSHFYFSSLLKTLCSVATAPTVYGIETESQLCMIHQHEGICCNSTYRLRYWNSRF